MSNTSKPTPILPQPEEAKFRRPLFLSDGDIFGRIWSQPRSVFAYLDDAQYDRYTIVLLFIASATMSLELAIANHMSRGMSLPFIITISVITGGILGIVLCYVFAAVAGGIGEWFGGFANMASIVRVIAHGLVPVITTSLVTVIKIVVFGMDLFKENFSPSNYTWGLAAFYIISLLIQLSLVTCSIFLFVIGMSTVQRMPIGVAILNLVLPSLILLVVAGIIAVPFL